MAIATLSLITQEALELHFEGNCYGPISHTQALGALLFALQPDSVELATRGYEFEHAMERVLEAARQASTVLEAVAAGEDDSTSCSVPAETLALWIGTCCQTAPPHEVRSLQTKISKRLGKTPWSRSTLH